MLFAYALASCVLAASAVCGRTLQPEAVDAKYEEAETQTQDDQTAVVLGFGRDDAAADMSDLKYVMAIRNSSMWTDVKRRTVMISSDPRLTELLDAQPERLSDGDLAAVRQACHDGLKCVAVDQLLVLRSATLALGNGVVSVRKVLTKITHVLTKYTTEFHEDTYRYEEVSESDDPSKVSETVTVMVEDNKELCGLNVAGGGAALMGQETVSTVVSKDTQNVVASGTVRDATAGLLEALPAGTDGYGDDDVRPVSTAYPPIREREITGFGADAVDDVQPRHDDAAVRALWSGIDESANPQNHSVDAPVGGRAGRPRANNTDAVEDVQPRHDDAAVRALWSGVDESASPRNDLSGSRASRPRVNVTDAVDDVQPRHDDAFVKALWSGIDESAASPNNNEVGGAKNEIFSMGDANEENVQKGYAEDGVVNNGRLKVKNLNRGNINRGAISQSGADGGIINVGPLNNGPTNYGTINNFENYGTSTSLTDSNIQKYLTSVDKMYSTILDGLDNQ